MNIDKNVLIDEIDSLVFWMDELLRLARELQSDLKNYYEPVKGWPPHINALEGDTDYDTVLKNGKVFLDKIKGGGCLISS